jgi:class 3 adenylate cyclase
VKPRYPLALKITGASFLVVVVVLGFLAVLDFREQERALEDKFGLTLQHIAQTAALFIDGNAHERVHANRDAAGEDFAKLRGVLERVRRENALREDQIYTLRPVGAQDQYEFVVMLQAKTFVGDRYTPPVHTRDIPRWVLADGTPRYTHIYTDEHGTFVSAYAPVRDGGGKLVALLEVDYNIDAFVSELRASRMRRLLALPLALGLALILSLIVARSITKSVRGLVDGTVAVADGRYDAEVRVATRDELRVLADAFNHMLGGLRERFAMLKFVPRHTRDVIALAVKGRLAGEVSFVAQKRDVAVLFADIRGFTALSDKLPAQSVIEMLNIYLKEEARLIEQHGGSIDKFIGDAVMAVFEGEDRYRRAVESALAIQVAVRRLNDEHAFEQAVEIGVGIAGGEVVMGSIGYEARMEFAVIGRIVNLASRLTSVAGKSEVVVSAEAWAALGGCYGGDCIDGVKLKGFADAITCWKVGTRVDPAAVIG